MPKLKYGVRKLQEKILRAERRSIQCVAPDCEVYFIPKVSFQIYCSRLCCERTKTRNKRSKRASNGLCPQCGGEMDFPESRHPKVRGEISYCSRCQDHFRELRMNKIKQKEQTTCKL